MKLKEMLILVACAILTSWAIQYFIVDRFIGNKEAQESSFVVAPIKQESRPLNSEVDFIESKRTARGIITPIKTEWADLEFTTDGASLLRLTFQRKLDDAQHDITTIFPPSEHEKEKRAFLLAFEQKTPFFYELVDKKADDATTTLTYKARTGDVEVAKIFTVYHRIYQIDLSIQIQNNTLGRPRLFFPSPYMPHLGEKDVVSGIVVDKNNKFEKIARDKLDIERKGWYEPKLFGADDRYFIHAMIKDQDSFAQRAYFAYFGQHALTAVVEGPSQETISAQLSFYLGPKESEAIAPVDNRLEQAFEYSGLLAPISKLLLAILNWLYSYLHNYGVSIIVLTIFIRLVLFPFTMKSEQTLKESAERQKKLAYIEKKYKDDPQALARERMEFMKKHGMPGLGGGCLPLLVQIPIFFALSRVLANSIELYQAPMWWISDLSARDPYYIIPLLMVGSMLVQALAADAKQRLFMIVAALAFGAFASSLPAGLGLYLFVSTLLGVLQSYIVKWWGKK